MFWTLGQQLCVRLCVALKFFLMARMLGPEAIGQAVLALTLLAILESCSDFGFGQAVVQKSDAPSARLLGQVFTMQASRGWVLAGLLTLVPWVGSGLGFSSVAAASFVVLPFLALAKTSISPRYAMVQRRRQFKPLFAIDVTCVVVDLGLSVVFAMQGWDAASILLGSLCGESLKAVISWFISRDPVALNFQWREAQDIASFGLWVWLGGLVTTVLNQGDKILVSILFGERELGIYQTVIKGAQLLFSDASIALCMYAYPVLAQANREDRFGAWRRYATLRLGLLGYVAAVSLPALVWGNDVLMFVLGAKWSGVDRYFAFAMLPVIVGAFLTLRVTFDRALGFPSRAVLASLLQLLAFLAAVLGLGALVPGAAAVMVASFVGGLVAYAFLEWRYRKPTS